MTTLTRTKTDATKPSYALTGPSGTLTYDSAFADLDADGDLPPWVVAYGYAVDCRDSLDQEGEEGLWTCMELLYRRAER